VGHIYLYTIYHYHHKIIRKHKRIDDYYKTLRARQFSGYIKKITKRQIIFDGWHAKNTLTYIIRGDSPTMHITMFSFNNEFIRIV